MVSFPSPVRTPLLVAALVLAFAAAADAQVAATGGAAALAPGWYARLDTSAGEIVARLLPEQAPQSVAHFVALARGTMDWIDPFTGESVRRPYYDGLEVHKVKAAERFEVGDPTGTGRGAVPVYVPPEEAFGPVDFSKGGRLGMTRATLGRVSGSLFFVTASPQPWLSGRHPCFGVVVSGEDVVWRITSVKAHPSGRPIEPVVLRHVEIFSAGDPAPLPQPQTYVPVTPRMKVRDEVRALGDIPR